MVSESDTRVQGLKKEKEDNNPTYTHNILHTKPTVRRGTAGINNGIFYEPVPLIDSSRSK